MIKPASIIISYTVVGIVVYLVLCALGEVAAWLPEPSTAPAHAVRFCDPALGFTLGWIYWLKYLVVTPNQLTAGALVISYWLDMKYVNPGVWISTFLVIIVATNYWGSQYIGTFEFALSSFKILVLFALTVLSLVIALGGGPDHEVRGFRYWRDPGAFAPYGDHELLGRFQAVCKTMSSTTFAYLGSELLGMTMLHIENPPEAAARAIKLTFYRVLIFNIFSVTLLGMLVPFDSQDLAFAGNASKPTTVSAFIVAIRMAHIPILPSILNAFILFFVLSAANQALYMATRTIYGLSQEQKAPAFLSHTNRRGIPIYSLGICSGLASLAFLNISSDSKVLFGYFVNIITMFSLLTWISILITHISFVRARKAQKIPDSALLFRAPFGVWGSWFALLSCMLISLMRGFDVVEMAVHPKRFDYKTFVTSYLAVPLYVSLVVGYKVLTRCKSVNPEEADLWTVTTIRERREAKTTVPKSEVEAFKGKYWLWHWIITAWLL
ncbi:putative amino acid permease [Aspergillus clavatus NRRL 1]|uniref:Amino acid permease, putative n=1 Tax=Aspergillus clavatus (strain ATCC 1007 / CBS 513.65 / DSM 816 / NCTC 3887 / NRRL 1 / QM 1276 / 107) TaxID=344612 RepID=A1CAB7_ASPCL|nr:amino acid permease, putative [Aspergillus clavatus NRRL 1]EAW12685.1 amino acid permease, putative [Aspergillus clavatus NRRL 1]